MCQQDSSKSVPAVLILITKFTAANLKNPIQTCWTAQVPNRISIGRTRVYQYKFGMLPRTFKLRTIHEMCSNRSKTKTFLQFTTQLVYFVRLSTRNKLHSCLLQPMSSFAYRIVGFMVLSEVLKFFPSKSPILIIDINHSSR